MRVQIEVNITRSYMSMFICSSHYHHHQRRYQTTQYPLYFFMYRVRCDLISSSKEVALSRVARCDSRHELRRGSQSLSRAFLRSLLRSWSRGATRVAEPAAREGDFTRFFFDSTDQGLYFRTPYKYVISYLGFNNHKISERDQQLNLANCNCNRLVHSKTIFFPSLRTQLSH